MNKSELDGKTIGMIILASCSISIAKISKASVRWNMKIAAPTFASRLASPWMKKGDFLLARLNQVKSRKSVDCGVYFP
jgi:hypothetical protein